MNEKQCRDFVKARAKVRCEMCGHHKPTTLHHRKKKSHLPKNKKWEVPCCVALCGHGTTGCHGWVESNPNEAETLGFHVRPWQDFHTIPILLHGTDWVLLAESENPDNGYIHVERP